MFSMELGKRGSDAAATRAVALRARAANVHDIPRCHGETAEKESRCKLHADDGGALTALHLQGQGREGSRWNSRLWRLRSWRWM